MANRPLIRSEGEGRARVYFVELILGFRILCDYDASLSYHIFNLIAAGEIRDLLFNERGIFVDEVFVQNLGKKRSKVKKTGVIFDGALAFLCVPMQRAN